jgi:hypothetical protein
LLLRGCDTLPSRQRQTVDERIVDGRLAEVRAQRTSDVGA